MPTEERITLATADECFASCFCTDGHWICSSSVRLKRHFMCCFVFIWKPTLSCLHSAAHAHYNKIRRIKKKKKKKKKEWIQRSNWSNIQTLTLSFKAFFNCPDRCFPQTKATIYTTTEIETFFSININICCEPRIYRMYKSMVYIRKTIHFVRFCGCNQTKVNYHITFLLRIKYIPLSLTEIKLNNVSKLNYLRVKNA